LNNNFLAGLQHFGNQLRAAVLFVPRMSVLRRLMRTPAGTAASAALRTASAAHRALKTGARLFGNARARGRLRLAGLRRLRGALEILVAFGVNLFGAFGERRAVVFLPVGVLFELAFAIRFVVSFSVKLGVFLAGIFAVFLGLPRTGFRRQRFVMHFVG
jgi:hypothetical protein